MSGIADYSQIYLLLAFYGVFKAWNRAGGWPEAWYRLRGTNYHQFYVIMPNNKIIRPIVKDSDLEVHSPAKWSLKKGGDYVLAGNDCRFSNPHGAPSFLYIFDDSRPLPVMQTARDNASNPLPKMDPMLVRAGYHNKNLEKLNGLTDRGHAVRDSLLFLMVLIALLATFLTMYYSYNTTCAVHSLACVGAGR